MKTVALAKGLPASVKTVPMRSGFWAPRLEIIVTATRAKKSEAIFIDSAMKANLPPQRTLARPFSPHSRWRAHDKNLQTCGFMSFPPPQTFSATVPPLRCSLFATAEAGRSQRSRIDVRSPLEFCPIQGGAFTWALVSQGDAWLCPGLTSRSAFGAKPGMHHLPDAWRHCRPLTLSGVIGLRLLEIGDSNRHRIWTGRVPVLAPVPLLHRSRREVEFEANSHFL